MAELYPLGPVLGLVVGVLAKWLIDRRRSSGKVSTTEADKLWAEAEAFRKNMRIELERRMAECKHEMRDIQLQNLELRIENHELRGENMTLQFLAHPDIPKDVKDDFIEHQKAHVLKLKKAHAELQAKLSREAAAEAAGMASLL